MFEVEIEDNDVIIISLHLKCHMHWKCKERARSVGGKWIGGRGEYEYGTIVGVGLSSERGKYEREVKEWKKN